MSWCRSKGRCRGKPDPLTIVDMNFILNNVVFPKEGTYFIRFWTNGHILMQRPFDVRKIPTSGGKEE